MRALACHASSDAATALRAIACQPCRIGAITPEALWAASTISVPWSEVQWSRISASCGRPFLPSIANARATSEAGAVSSAE